MNPKHIIKKGSIVEIGMPKNTTSEFWSHSFLGTKVIVSEDTGWGAISRVDVIYSPRSPLKRIIHKFCITSDKVLEGGQDEHIVNSGNGLKS